MCGAARLNTQKLTTVIAAKSIGLRTIQFRLSSPKPELCLFGIEPNSLPIPACVTSSRQTTNRSMSIC